MMSPEMWRDLIKPELKRIADVGKAHGLPVAYHCCGALKPIIPDLIEIGVDVLEPVQWRCVGMDREGLKRDFGDDLVFMGAMDNQHTLPFGTVVRVTNLRNSRSTEVRVVDRGPAKGPQRKGVIIDLTQAAARELGFREQGKAPVHLQVLGQGSRDGEPLAPWIDSPA